MGLFWIFKAGNLREVTLIFFTIFSHQFMIYRIKQHVVMYYSFYDSSLLTSKRRKLARIPSRFISLHHTSKRLTLQIGHLNGR